MSLFSNIKARIMAWLKSRFDIPLNSKLAFSKKDFVTTRFTHGVEIFNDNTTTMEFVVDMLMKHFDLKKDDAIVAMLICHEYESVVMPVETIEYAEQIAQLITDEAREQDCMLVCKAASAQQDPQVDV